MNVPGYSYAEFCAAVADLHGTTCWVRETLAERTAPLPAGLLNCSGALDGHHLIPKQLIKRELRHGIVGGVVRHLAGVAEPVVFEDGTTRGLAELLNDGRNGVPACRRHHDLVERALVQIKRAELPAPVEQFAAEVGLGWWLDREFGPCAAR